MQRLKPWEPCSCSSSFFGPTQKQTIRFSISYPLIKTLCIECNDVKCNDVSMYEWYVSIVYIRSCHLETNWGIAGHGAASPSQLPGNISPSRPLRENSTVDTQLLNVSYC